MTPLYRFVIAVLSLAVVSQTVAGDWPTYRANPAGGLVLMPDASARCSCSYLNRSWIALQGVE